MKGGFKVRIRLLKNKDINDVVKLIIYSYAKEDKTRRWNEETAMEYLRRIYKLNKEMCFVAVDGEKIVSIALCIIRPEFSKNILVSDMLLVHPEYREKGLATRLMQKICIKAKNKYNIQSIETSIYTLLDFPVMWYEAIGFKKKKNIELLEAKLDNVLNKL